MTSAADAAAGAPSASVRILPPRPRRRDWAAAGLCAGLLLALAEWALLWASGWPLPPRLAFPLFAATAALVAVPATLAGVALQRGGVAPSHSAVVGALLGPLLLAPAAGTFVALFALSGSGGWAAAAAGLLAVVGAALAGVLGARTFDRLEDGGLAMSGPVVFGLAAALLAIGEAVSAGGAGARSLLPAGLLLIGVAVLVTVAVRIMARRGSVPWPWGRTLALLIVVAAVAPFAPRALPWVLYQGYDRPSEVGPASVLVVDLGSFAGAAAGAALEAPEAWLGPDVAVLAEEGVRYDDLRASGNRGLAAALLAPPGVTPVLEALAARGYATAAFVRDPARGDVLFAPYVDATPGPGGLLDAIAPRTAAGPVLRTLPETARDWLGLTGAERTPAQLTADALDWLLWWRATRPISPAFLVVDYGAGVASSSPESLDPALRRLLDALEQLELAPRTLVLVGGTAAPGPGGAGGHRLVVRAPPVNRGAPRDTVVDRSEEPAVLAAFLRGIPEQEAEHTSPLAPPVGARP